MVKSSVSCCFNDYTGIYSFKKTILNYGFFVSAAAVANYFASEILCCITAYHTVTVREVLKVCVLLFYWVRGRDFPHSRTQNKGLLLHHYLYLMAEAGEKDSTCCCSRGIHSAAAGHVNICHAFPYLLARTYFSISLILLLCDCQI